jgi:glycerol-3-phosphate O-acyltransferase
MTTAVTLPAWLLWALSALAAAWVVQHVVVPCVRWVLRRRVNRVIHELNTRLHLKLQPFKLTRRQSLLDRLLFDTKVIEAAQEHARANDLRQESVISEVRGYAKEIVPSFNAYVYFRLGYWLARGAARALYRVRLGEIDGSALEQVDPRATVVFVINHRSNMDYLLVSYMVAERTALSYAVGEWARIWPLDTLVRSMGAFFVRRNSKNPLYRKVLERYVAMATAEGVTQAVFPEGGLSRDGRLRAPKLGLLDYIVRFFDPRGERDVVFVPVGLNYDRTLEDRTLLLDVAEGEEAPRRRASAAGAGGAVGNTLRFLAKNLGLMLRNEWHRFGYACLNFGEPLSLAAWCTARGVEPHRLAKEPRIEAVGALAAELMRRIGEAVPVTPVALVATAFVETGEPLSGLELKARIQRVLDRLRAAGAHLYVPRRDLDYATNVGLRMLVTRHLVIEEQGLYRIAPDEGRAVRYYANSIAHLVPEAA